MRVPLRSLLAASVLLAASACSGQDLAPTAPRAMTLYGCEITPGCMDGGGGGTNDPSPGRDGYWMGSTVTPEVCFSASGAGITDRDLDAMDDTCEQRLAERFRPMMSQSLYDCDTGREPYWAVKHFPNQGSNGVVRLAYLMAYYVDCGTPAEGLTCPLADIGGKILAVAAFPLYLAGVLRYSNEPGCAGHQGDSEFITIDVEFIARTQHWAVHRAFYSAHYGTFTDQSQDVWYGELEYPDVPRGFPRSYVARDKHGNFISRDRCYYNLLGFIPLAHPDDCFSVAATGPRLEFDGMRNLGSYQAPMVNMQVVSHRDSSDACVPGGRLRQYYPEIYGLECFWRYDYKFAGWSLYSQTTDSSPYLNMLVTKFECYGLTVLYQCVDMGASRAPSGGPA